MKEDKTKHTLFLRAGDMEYLGDLLRPRGISASLAVRKTISRYVDDLRSREKQDQPLNLGDMTND